MVSGAVYAVVLVKPIADNLARAGVLKGTALEAEVRSRGRIGGRPAVA
jgi:energy-coupling factor transport system substrate-specific component